MDELEIRLKKIVGDQVYSSKEKITPYLSDASYFTGDVPLAVVAPKNTYEVSRIMSLCSEMKVPVVVRGGGTSLTGGSILHGNGIVINMSRFDRIIETKIEDKYTIVEPGVRLDELNSYLEQFHHFYPPDPASSKSATVGGSIATNAGGLRAAMYGTTKNWVLGLEVVMPDGEILIFGGRTLKRTAGYDLTSLMVGSEGTLGIITKAILKIWPIPEVKGRAVAYYQSIESVGDAVSEMKKRGIIPMIAEFIDKMTMSSITKMKGLKFPSAANYMMIVDVASTEESIERELQAVAEILKMFNPIEITTTTDHTQMEIMYEARKGAFASLLTERNKATERVVIGDIVVPVSNLAKALSETREKMEEFGIKAGLIGHAGDGNIHANIFADLNDVEEMERIEKFQKEFGTIAIKNQGSVSAEHGIGMEKIDLLEYEVTANNTYGTLSLMKKIKAVFDPQNILNRGKMFK